ncbi:MAG: site-specific integrase [Coriobacteriales bacterium]|jgi:integrase|nr:site-specific integrase [Coriobacteriales bacterium]
MRIKGTGCVRQVKNNKGEPVKNSWQLILSLGYDPLDKENKKKLVQKCRHFSGTKTEARRALSEFKRELEYGLKVDADKATFGEYARQWKDSREVSGRLAPSTIARDKYTIKHLVRHLGGVQLGDIDATTVRNLYAAFSREGLGPQSVAKVAVALKQILRQAVNDDIILRNPCDRVEAPKLTKPARGSALDKAGVARLVEALGDAESKDYPLARSERQQQTSDMSHVAAARLALAAGLRRGEVLGLSWRDVDLESATIYIRNTLCNTSGELKPPKTATSNRTISLDGRMLADLKRWKQQQAEYLFSLGIGQGAETPVISTETGSRMEGNNLDRWWRRFQERYGFEGLRFHDLRHTHATMLVSSGLNIKAVSSRLGHASVGITLDLYAHAQREDDEKAAAIIGELMAQPAPKMGQVVNL